MLVLLDFLALWCPDGFGHEKAVEAMGENREVSLCPPGLFLPSGWWLSPSPCWKPQSVGLPLPQPQLFLASPWLCCLAPGLRIPLLFPPAPPHPVNNPLFSVLSVSCVPSICFLLGLAETLVWRVCSPDRIEWDETARDGLKIQDNEV